MQWFLERVLGAPSDLIVSLGGRMREGGLYVRIETRALWAAESRTRKVKALMRLRWRPSDEVAGAQARESYLRDIFGGEDDWGNQLGRLYDWHLGRDWAITALTAEDERRATALGSFTVLTRLRYDGIVASPLNLRLGQRFPDIAGLVYPLVAKMPVISLRYFLDLDVRYAFDAVRRANHSRADDVIGFLYELLFLQQKTAIALLEYALRTQHAEAHKGEAELTRAEVDAVIAADGLFASLKASVEKTLALVGAIYGITDLDAKKEHRKRLNALRAGIPKGVQELFYAEFLFEMIGPEQLADLNTYRTGLLHKKGIADLQPHNYVGQAAGSVPLRKVFAVLHEQHTKNTALLLVALALLTDDLAQRDPPPFALTDIPGGVEHAEAQLRATAERADTALTAAIDSAPTSESAGELGRLHAARGGARRHLGRVRDAVADFEAALVHGVSDPAHVYENLGAALMDSDDAGTDAAAVEAFTRAVEIAPDNAHAYYGRALAYENLGDLASAADDFDRIDEHVARSPELLEKRGLWRLRLGRPGDALADFDKAASLGHEPLDLLTGRAAGLQEIGDLPGALREFDRAIERHPTAVVARVNRAHARAASGDLAGARADVDWVAEHGAAHHGAAGAFVLRAALRDQGGDPGGAIADLERVATALGPDAPADVAEYLRQLRADDHLNATHADAPR